MRTKTDWRISKLKAGYENFCYVERDHHENGKFLATEMKLVTTAEAAEIIENQPEYI